MLRLEATRRRVRQSGRRVRPPYCTRSRRRPAARGGATATHAKADFGAGKIVVIWSGNGRSSHHTYALIVGITKQGWLRTVHLPMTRTLRPSTGPPSTGHDSYWTVSADAAAIAALTSRLQFSVLDTQTIRWIANDDMFRPLAFPPAYTAASAWTLLRGGRDVRRLQNHQLMYQ